MLSSKDKVKRGNLSLKKRILILTADAGFGHRSAAKAVAEALRETRGRSAAVEIVNLLNERRVPRWLRDIQSDYDRIARDLPEMYKLGYQATDADAPVAMIQRAMQAILYEATRKVVRDKRPDAIVSTYPLYQAPLGAVFTITKKFIPLITVVTDLATVHQYWFNEYPDLTVVPTEVVRRLALKAGLPARRIEVIGIPVHPALAAAKRAKAALRAELGWDPRLTTVLLVGSRRSDLYLEAARVLNHSGLPVQLVLIAGGDKEQYAAFKKIKWHRPARVYNFVKNMPALMRAADCIVCKAGGLTVTESLAVGLPLLLTDVIPGQETGNADYVVKGGAGVLLETPLQALETLCHWLEKGGALLQERSANAAKLGRPRAAFEVAERAWSLAVRGPEEREPSQILALPRLIEFFKSFKVKVDE